MSPGAVFSICWATDSQLIMQVVINIKAGDNMGKACTSRATGDHSTAILCFSFTHTAFPRKHNFTSVFSLESKKKIDLAPPLNFAKSRKEQQKGRKAYKANLTHFSFVDAENLLETIRVFNYYRIS